LVEGDDFNEPIADASRSILDGHIVLSRRLATAGHFPAIEVLESVSRVRDRIIDAEHRRAANEMQRLLAAYREKEDLIAVGAYQPGSSAEVDAAIAARDAFMEFLRQRPDEPAGFEDTRRRLLGVVDGAGGQG